MKKKMLALLMAVGIGCTGVQAQAAGNVTDTNLPTKKISFSYDTAARTPLRTKEDKTSHYLKNTSGFNLWVRSLNSSNVNCTYKSYAIVKPGEWFIWNTVKESGYSSCKLDITTATSGTTGTLRGVWSPDSVGSYPAANP